jgi:hypothetical protein
VRECGQCGAALSALTTSRATLSGGTPVTLAFGLQTPTGVAVDNTAIYFAEYAGGTIKRLAR